MTKKVTGADLKKLLEGALSERTSVKLSGNKVPMLNALDVPVEKHSDFTIDQIMNMAKSAKPPKTFDIDDMYKAYADSYGGTTSRNYDNIERLSNHTTNQDIKNDWEAVKASPQPEDPKAMGTIKDIDIDTQTYTPDSMAFQQMASIGTQNSDPNSPSGMMPEGLAASVATFFNGTNTFYERVQKISKFSDAVFTDEKITGMNVNEVLAASLFGDYLNTIVKEIDSGSGAYLFEVLLAQMAGGSVSGKGDVDKSGNVVTGSMGAVDFLMNDGTFGSAKYYANLGSGTITQSVKGFKNKAGKSTLYVIAHKVGDQNAAMSKRGESTPDKIQAINIYFVSVMPLVEVPTKGEHFAIAINGDNVRGGFVKGSDLKISDAIDKNTDKMTILISPNNKKFKEALATAADKSDTEIKEAFAEFKDIFSELNNANQKMQRYSSTGDTEAGEASLLGLDTADEKMVNLIGKISVGKKVSGDRKKRTITEQKITADFLKNLISESFKR